MFLFLAQAAAETPAGGAPGGFGSMFIPLICIGVIFYFLILRPQQKKGKEQQALISSLKSGDKVVTSGGIHGLISNVKDKTVILKVADNVKIEVDKAAVGVVTKSSDAAIEA